MWGSSVGEQHLGEPWTPLFLCAAPIGPLQVLPNVLSTRADTLRSCLTAGLTAPAACPYPPCNVARRLSQGARHVRPQSFIVLDGKRAEVGGQADAQSSSAAGCTQGRMGTQSSSSEHKPHAPGWRRRLCRRFLQCAVCCVRARTVLVWGGCASQQGEGEEAKGGARAARGGMPRAREGSETRPFLETGNA